MNTGLGETVTVQELEEQVAAFEVKYGMRRDQFLARYADDLDDLGGVEDADAWFMAYRFLDRLRCEGNHEIPPWLSEPLDEPSEGPKGSSSFSSAGGFFDAARIHFGGYNAQAEA